MMLSDFILVLSEMIIFLFTCFSFKINYSIFKKLKNKMMLYTFSGVLVIWALNSLFRICELCGEGFEDLSIRTMLGISKSVFMLLFLIYLNKATEKYL